jgi:hypothetical protein
MPANVRNEEGQMEEENKAPNFPMPCNASRQ